MQVAIRSYLVAGATFACACTMAVAPLPPAQDVSLPVDQAPVRLTGNFAELLVESVAAYADTPEKLYQLVRVTAPVVPEIVGSVLARPDQAVGAMNNVIRVGEAMAFGTVANGADFPAGFIAPDPVSFPPVPEFPGEFTEPIPSLISDTEEAARAVWVGGLTAEEAPQVITTSIIQSHRIGVTVIQAQGLIRSASLGAVQRVVTASTHNGDVANASVEGATDIRKAVFGDPDLDEGAGGVAPDPDTGLPVASTRKLGAVRTVGTGFRNAASATSAAIEHDVDSALSPSSRRSATRPE
jgi:hypothetical protein